MVEVKHLTKKYGALKALDDVSFKTGEGEIVGLLGPNGAGKTTTMNIMSGYLSATEGGVSINGFDIVENQYEARKITGYLPENPPLYTDMTVSEYLEFVYELKQCRLNKKRHFDDICSLVKIESVYSRLIKNLSKGYRQRVGMAQALIGNPQLLILDEPTSGLDPKQIIEMRELIKSLGKNHTVIFSSHTLSEVQAVCNRMIILDRGRLVADSTPDKLSEKTGSAGTFTLKIKAPETEVMKSLRKIDCVSNVRNLGLCEPHGVYEYSVKCKDTVENDARVRIFEQMSENNYPIVEFKSSEISLEDIFLRITDGKNDHVEGRR